MRSLLLQSRSRVFYHSTVNRCYGVASCQISANLSSSRSATPGRRGAAGQPTTRAAGGQRGRPTTLAAGGGGAIPSSSPLRIPPRSARDPPTEDATSQLATVQPDRCSADPPAERSVPPAGTPQWDSNTAASLQMETTIRDRCTRHCARREPRGIVANTRNHQYSLPVVPYLAKP